MKNKLNRDTSHFIKNGMCPYLIIYYLKLSLTLHDGIGMPGKEAG
jgi:hypothetical protein